MEPGFESLTYRGGWGRMTLGQITARDSPPGDPGSPPAPKLSALGPEVPCAQAETGPMVHIRLSNPSQGMVGVGWSDCLSSSSHQDHRLQGTPFERRGFLCRQKRVNGQFSSVFQMSSLTIRNLFKLHPRLYSHRRFLKRCLPLPHIYTHHYLSLI